jgi:hypothetical protein
MMIRPSISSCHLRQAPFYLQLSSLPLPQLEFLRPEFQIGNPALLGKNNVHPHPSTIILHFFFFHSKDMYSECHNLSNQFVSNTISSVPRTAHIYKAFKNPEVRYRFS